MRRLLATVLLLASAAVPARAAAPARAGAVYHLPGRVPVGPVPAGEWLDRQYEAASGGRLATDLMHRFDAARATAAETSSEVRLATLWDVADLDGDKVADLLVYDTTLRIVDGRFAGPLDLAVVSGRTGVRRWHRHWEDIALALPYEARAGAAGARGILLVRPFQPSQDETAYRLVGLGGARGEVVYDRTVSSADGLGDVAWGGTFDAYPRGGTDVLVGRRLRKTSLGAGTFGFNPPEVSQVQPFTLDGRDGKVRSAHDPMLVVGGRSAYLASGDHDGDGRDDFLLVHQGLRDKGDVTAYSVVEGKQIWTNSEVPVGWSVRVGGTGGIVGDAKEDVVLDSWMTGNALLHVAGVTDGVPLLEGTPAGIHGLLFDGATGAVKWDRIDGDLAFHTVAGDLDRDRRSDVLAVGIVQPNGRDGIRFTAVTGANKLLYRRDVTVPRPVARNGIAVGFGSAGDVDGDGVEDLYYVLVSSSPLSQSIAQGYLLARHGSTLPTPDMPLVASLDGRGADRFAVTRKERTLLITMRDGLHGTPYWHLTLDRAYAWGVGRVLGQRGRCAGVLLVGLGQRPGSLWAAVLDGGTGRPRWAKPVNGTAIHPAVTAAGPHARCA